MTSKKNSTKEIYDQIWSDKKYWTVQYGYLNPGPGRPQSVDQLFKVVAEKIPFRAINAIKKQMIEEELGLTGVYIAHDSMGYARYVGRGNIFSRLQSHFKSHPHELYYFSFYVVKEKKHEREIETLLIRAAGPQLQFNDRKKRVDIKPGDIKDFEPGTLFFERQHKKGKKNSS